MCRLIFPPNDLKGHEQESLILPRVSISLVECMLDAYHRLLSTLHIKPLSQRPDWTR